MNLCNPHSCSGIQFGLRSVTPIQDLAVTNYILGNSQAGSWDLQLTLEVLRWGPVWVLVGFCLGRGWVLFGSFPDPGQILFKSHGSCCFHSFRDLWNSSLFLVVIFRLGLSKTILHPCIALIYVPSKLTFSIEPHHIVLSNVTGPPPLIPGSHMKIRFYHFHLLSVDFRDLWHNILCTPLGVISQWCLPCATPCSHQDGHYCCRNGR